MAVGDQLSAITDGLFGGSLTLLLWIAIGFVLIVVGGGLVYYFMFYRKSFDILIKIISERSGQDNVLFDRGAILRDHKHNTDYLRLWNAKVDLELPKFDIMYHTNRGDYLELQRTSQRSFRFLTPPRVDKKFIVRQNGKLYPIARLKQYPIESDLTWILERLKVNKGLINPEGIFMKILDNAPHIIAIAFSFFMLWVIFKFAPQMLDSLADLVKELKTEDTVEIIGSMFPLLFLKWRK